MREEFVNLSKNFEKLKYKNFVKFNKNIHITNGFKNVNKIPFILVSIIFIIIEILICKFLPWIFGTLFGILLIYIVALLLDFLVDIKVSNKQIYIKKFIFKKVIDENKVKKIYLITSKHKSLGGIRAKIKIIYETKRGDSIYNIDTMFLLHKDVKNFLKNIQVEELSEEEKKGNFEKTFIDETLLETIDFIFLIPMGLCIMVDWLLR